MLGVTVEPRKGPHREIDNCTPIPVEFGDSAYRTPKQRKTFKSTLGLLVPLGHLVEENVKLLGIINHQPKLYRNLIDLALPKMNSPLKITKYIRRLFLWVSRQNEQD